MRGLGTFQVAQMKHRDTRVFVLCQHLRLAIDALEQIASNPYEPPERPKPEAAPVPTPGPPPELPRERLAYSVNDAAVALGIGKTTLWKAISDGRLRAFKFGARTLIPAEALRSWIESFPRVGRPARE